jgi:hypothetical protein
VKPRAADLNAPFLALEASGVPGDAAPYVAEQTAKTLPIKLRRHSAGPQMVPTSSGGVERAT